MKTRDESFIIESIYIVEELFLQFVDTLMEYTLERKASFICNLVEKLVRVLNKVNKTFSHVIGPLEGIKLCDFINNLAASTGFFFTNTINVYRRMWGMVKEKVWLYN